MKKEDILGRAALQKGYEAFAQKLGQTTVCLVQDSWQKEELIQNNQVDLATDVTVFEKALQEKTDKPVMVSAYLVNELLLEKLVVRTGALRPVFYDLC